jgi:hypothetical protein
VGLRPAIVLDHGSSWDQVGTVLSLSQDRRPLVCPFMRCSGQKGLYVLALKGSYVKYCGVFAPCGSR